LDNIILNCFQYLIGSWYTKEERGKRVGLFYCTAALASMFSGYLQAGAYSGLDGVFGKQGWQWLFIVCGIISLPIAFLGFFFIPDFPETTRAFYITKEEAERQCQRLVAEGQKPLGHNPWTRKKFFGIVKQWQFWVLPLGYFFVQGSFPSQQPVMALWLKSKGHTVYQRNVWPTGQVAVGVVVQILAGTLSDSPLLKGRRWPAIIVMQAGTLFSTIILAVWNIPDTLKYVAYYFMYFSAGVPGPYFAWYSDLIPHDHEMRGFVIAASNMFSYIMSIWYSIAVWRTIEAPRFKPGFTAAAVLGVAMISLTLIVRLLQRRIRVNDKAEPEDIEAPAASPEVSEDTSNVSIAKENRI
jgi:ACS family pantothenate transporter-like MFS transporter